MKKVIVIIERAEDGTYGVHAPKLKNFIVGEGDTVAAAKEDFLAGYEEMKEVYREDGLPIPEELSNITFEYQYDLSAFYEAHPYLNISKLAEYIKINSSLMRQYKRGQYISEKQVLRIQEGIRAIGKELSTITLVK